MSEFMIYCMNCEHIMPQNEADNNEEWGDYHCPDCGVHATEVDLR